MENSRLTDVAEITVFNKSLGANRGFVWRVGNTYSPAGVKVVCTKITHDTNSYYFNGQSRWVVFVAKPEDLDNEVEFAVYENVELEAKRDIRKIFVV